MVSSAQPTWIVSILILSTKVVVDDPYHRTKQSASESIDKVSHEYKKDSQGAIDELHKAGQHVKQSAHLAGQAVQDSFEQTKKEGSKWVDQVKQDTRDSVYQAKESTEAKYDKLKREGANLKDDAYDKLHHEGSQLKQDTEATYDKLKRDTTNLKDDAYEKLKREGTQLKQEAEATFDKFKREGANLKQEADHKIEHFKEEHHLKEGTRTPEDVVAHVHRSDAPGRTSIFDRASTAHGNPMVYEKHSTNPTKPGWERRMENYAEKTVHDTSTLVGKDTEKVRGVWEDKASRDLGRTPQQQQQDTSSFWSHLFGQASEKAQNLEKAGKEDLKQAKDDLYNKAKTTKDDMYDRAKQDADHVSDTIKNKKNQVKKDMEETKDTLYAKAENAKNAVVNKAQEVKESIYDESSIHDLHKEVSANADKWKKKSEQTAKSWYEKSADQVKDSLGSIKTAADKDLEWAERKVQDGIASAKDGVERIFNPKTGKYESSGLKGHVIRGERMAEEEMDNLRGTRAHVKLTPAEIIVEHAHGKEM